LKLKYINEKLIKIKLEDETKSSILDLINEKIESDIENLKNELNI